MAVNPADAASGVIPTGNEAPRNAVNGNPADAASGIVPSDSSIYNPIQNAVPDNPAGGGGQGGDVSDGDLPWAQVILPVTAAGVGGIGVNRHNLQVGTWVIGFFADGDDCQQPMIVGTIPGGPGQGTSGASTSRPTAAGKSTEANPNNGNPSNGPVPPATSRVPANARQVWNKLKSMGYTDAQAAGIMGNLMQESGLSTGALGDLDRGGSRGLAQWGTARWPGMVAYANSKGVSPYDVDAQLEYIKIEMDQNPRATDFAGAKLNNANTPEDAAAAFVAFEQPGGYRYTRGPTGDGSTNANGIANRKAYARQVYNQFAGGN